MTNSSPSSKLLPWCIVAIGALFYCYEYFLRITPSVMENELMGAYHIDAYAFGNLSAFYYYAYTPMQLVVGVLMDRYGPRLLLIVSCLLCSLGAYLFAASSLLWVAQLGRFLVGFGSAFAFVGVLKLATIWLPPKRFALISGLTTTLGMIGAMIGDISLSALSHSQGWRATINLSALIGIVISCLMFFAVHNVNPNRKNATNADENRSFRVLFGSFLTLIKKPQMWLLGIVGCLFYTTASTLAELWCIPYLKQAYQLKNHIAASYTSLIFLGWACGGPLAGWCADRYHRTLPLKVGGLITAGLLALLLYGPMLPMYGLALLLFGIGLFSAGQVVVFAIACDAVPAALSGTAIALTNMFVMVGGDIFQPVVGWILDNQHSLPISGEIPIYSAHDYVVALSILPIAYASMFFLSFFIKLSTAQN